MPAAADSFGIVSGRILSARDGKPLGGVRILTDSASASNAGTSRADGTFTVLGLAPGRNLVTLVADGFESRSCAYRIWPGGDTRVTFVLMPAPEPWLLNEKAGAASPAVAKAAPILATPECPAAPVGGGVVSDVYVIGD